MKALPCRQWEPQKGYKQESDLEKIPLPRWERELKGTEVTRQLCNDYTDDVASDLVRGHWVLCPLRKEMSAGNLER